MLFGFEDTEPEHEDARAHAEDQTTADPPSRTSPWLYAALGLLAGALLIGGSWALWPDSSTPLTQADVDTAIEEALDQADEAPADASFVFQQIAPSLVVVRAANAVEGEPVNIGGGVVINDKGEIITANHVVVNAASVDVLFADGSESRARLVQSNSELDIAVLEPVDRPATLVPAVLGNARTIQIGDPVFAVGNPLGLTGSISAGVVSGLQRNIPFPGQDDMVLENLIQFDAAVNQGNSGGPLLNRDGQVVGIVTALADPAGQGFFIGIGFAVPIDIAAGGAANGPSQ